MLATSTIDRRDIDLFIEVHSYSLAEHIFNCMTHYLCNYKNFEEFDKDVSTYLSACRYFIEAGYNQEVGSGSGKFRYTPMSVTTPDDSSFSKFHHLFMGDVYESLECHFSLESDGGQRALTSSTFPQKAQAIAGTTAFVIEQIERVVFSKYTKGTTALMLLGICRGNLSIQVHTP